MRWGKVVFLGLVVAIAAAAFAIGAGSNSSKPVVICAAKKGGDLTLADGKGKCGKGEKKLSIAKQGPVGPQGAVGPSGAAGTTEAPNFVKPGTSACATNTGSFCVNSNPSCYDMRNAGGALAPLSYRKDSDGFVHLEGAFGNFNASGACGPATRPVFYLPSGFRPTDGTHRFLVATCEGNGTGYITVAPNGFVEMLWVSSWCLDTSGIVFHADA